jgi:hypothetical protein
MSEQDFDKTDRNSIAIRDPKVAKFVKADTVMLTEWEIYNAYCCGSAIGQVCVEKRQGWAEMIIAFIDQSLENNFPEYRNSDSPEKRWLILYAYNFVTRELAKHQIALYSKEMKDGVRWGDH